LLGKGVDYVASLLTNDDTYYYLQTAWQTKQSGFVTFDGVNSTNGVQLLWFWTAFVLALAAKTKTGLLFASLVTCFTLNVLCYLPIWKFARTLGRPASAILIGGLWAKLVTDGTYWLALENSLHALVFWCLVWQAAVFFLRLSEGRRASMLPLTVLLVLNAWTRIDAAVFSLAVYVVCAGALVRARRGATGPEPGAMRQIASSALLGGAGVAVALGAFYLMGRSVLPVSALVKMSGRGGAESLLASAREMFTLSLPALLPQRIGGPNLLAVFGLASLVIVVLALSRRRSELSRTRAFRAVWITLAIGFAAYIAAAALSGAGTHRYFVWHRTPLYAFWILTMSAAVHVVVEAIARVPLWRLTTPADADRPGIATHGSQVARYSGVTIGAVLMVLSVARMFLPPQINPTRMLAIRYRAALWMGENLPAEATCAAWNAGQLGFYAPQKVINLDGLVNSAMYYEDVLSGRRPLTDYLSEKNVRYIVDYVENDLTACLEVVHAFPADADGRVLRVLRAPPQERWQPQIRNRTQLTRGCLAGPHLP
jgi:hypothetical protein